MKEFFDQIDGRILQIDFGKVFDWGYLSDPEPQTFALQNWSFFIGVVMLAVCVIALRYLRRPRQNIAKAVRFRWQEFFWRQSILVLVSFVFIFMRSQRVSYLSMRLWYIVLIILSIANLALAIWRVRKAMIHSNIETEDKRAAASFGNYLPKKNKKKKLH